MIERMRLVPMMLAAFGLTGCGVTTPNIAEMWDQDFYHEGAHPVKITGSGQMEYEIRKRCIAT
jgi:hypothetical protein